MFKPIWDETLGTCIKPCFCKTRLQLYAQILGLCLSVIAAVWMLVSLVGRNWVRVSFHYHEDRAWDWSLWNTCNTVEHEHVICVSAGKHM